MWKNVVKTIRNIDLVVGLEKRLFEAASAT
jgi:hypothetical protein